MSEALTDSTITGTCDVCGAPATSVARDIVETFNRDTGCAEFKPHNAVKHGCADHPPESEIHQADSVLGLLGWITRGA
jgi:hypothetical protein